MCIRDSDYGQEPGQVTASAENAQVTVLQANRENGLKAQIFVLSLIHI